MCFIAGFSAATQQVVGLIGSNGVAPLAVRWPAVGSYLGTGGLDLFLRVETVLGAAVACIALFNVVPRLALVCSTLLWSLFLYQLGPFDIYQPDSMLVSAGVVCALIAPGGSRPGLGEGDAPRRLGLATVWLLIANIYWGSAIGKWQNPAWRSLDAMLKYWESAPVPAWTGWYAQTYLPPKGVQAICVFVIGVEALGPLLLLGNRRSRVLFVAANGLLQLGIAITASYSFLNVLVVGLGMSALPDGTSSRVASGRRMPLVAVIGSLAYFVGSCVLMWTRLIPVSAHPLILKSPERGPGHLVNTYGLYEDVGRAGFRIEFQATEDGYHWASFDYRCAHLGEEVRPALVLPYQCRLDWLMWRAAKSGSIADDRVVNAIVSGLARRSQQVASLFAKGPALTRLRRVRIVLWEYHFAGRDDRARGKWWTRQLVSTRELALGV